jgi:hypothetical protein
MIKRAQDINESAICIRTRLIEMAVAIGVPFDALMEDVYQALANIRMNGLRIMGRNPKNYAYFLAGVAAAMQELMDVGHPEPTETLKQLNQKLAGVAVVQHGSEYVLNDNCSFFIDMGARPENHNLAIGYMKLISELTTKSNPEPLNAALGKLQQGLEKARRAQQASPAPASRLSPNQPVSPDIRQVLPRTAPSQGGNPPSGGGSI